MWLIAVALGLSLHHWVIHPELQGLDRWYQTDDMLNPLSHEIWINAALALHFLEDP